MSNRIIAPRQAELEAFLARFLAPKHQAPKQEKARPQEQVQGVDASVVMNRLRRTKTWPRIKSLLEGDDSVLPGPDQSASAGDLSVCSSLAYACGDIPDAQARHIIDEIIRNSARMRGKWDRIHRPADGATYGQMTIDAAISGTTDRWTDRVPVLEPTEQVEQAVTPQVVQATQETPPDTPTPRQKFPFQSMAELVTEPHPIEWLLKPFLTKDTLCTIYGDSGTYKTFVVLGMCVSIASGKPWLNKYAPRVSGPVFYICGEGFSGMAGRLRGQCLGYGIDGQDIPLFVSGQAVQVLDADSVAQMVAAIDELAQAHGQPVLIVLDTLSRCFGPGDENSTPDMTRFIAELDRIRSKYGCSIVTVHHTGLGDKTRSRGNSAHRGALDAEFRMESTSTDDKRLTCTKSKDAEAPADLYLTPEQIPLGWVDEDGDELTTLFLHATDRPTGNTKTRPKLTGARKVALDCLTRLSGTDEGYAPVHIDEWRKLAYESGITPSSSQSAKQRAFNRAATSLQDGNYVECSDDHYIPIPPDRPRQNQTNVLT
jgi:hypothetical protein